MLSNHPPKAGDWVRHRQAGWEGMVVWAEESGWACRSEVHHVLGDCCAAVERTHTRVGIAWESNPRHVAWVGVWADSALQLVASAELMDEIEPLLLEIGISMALVDLYDALLAAEAAGSL